MASKNDCVIPARMGPVITVAPICLGLVRSKMNLINASKPDLNSGLNLSNCKRERQCYNSKYIVRIRQSKKDYSQGSDLDVANRFHCSVAAQV